MLAASQNPGRRPIGATTVAMVFALLLRLVWGVPLPVDPERARSPQLLGGDHALCLARAPGKAAILHKFRTDDRPRLRRAGMATTMRPGAVGGHAAGGVILADARGDEPHLAFVPSRQTGIVVAEAPAARAEASDGAQARAPPPSARPDAASSRDGDRVRRDAAAPGAFSCRDRGPRSQTAQQSTPPSAGARDCPPAEEVLPRHDDEIPRLFPSDVTGRSRSPHGWHVRRS